MRSSISDLQRALCSITALVVLVTALLPLGPTLAAPPQVDAKTRARARALLVQGSKLLQAGDYAEALARFQDAYDLIPSPKIHYNFGQALDGLERSAEALEAFRRFLDEATDASPAAVANAREIIGKLERRVAILALTGDLAGATVHVNGRPVSPDRNREIVVNPGPQAIAAERPGSAPFVANVAAGAGQRVQVVVRFVPLGGQAVAAPVPGPIAPPEPSSKGAELPARRSEPEGEVGSGPPGPSRSARPWQRPLAFGLAGLAGLGLGVGVVTGRQSNQKFEAFNDDERCTTHPEAVDKGGGPCPGLYDEGARGRRLAIAAFIGAGVFTAAATVLFLTLPTEPTPGEPRALACAPLLHTPGATCALRF